MVVTVDKVVVGKAVVVKVAWFTEACTKTMEGPGDIPESCSLVAGSRHLRHSCSKYGHHNTASQPGHKAKQASAVATDMPRYSYPPEPHFVLG